MGANLQGARLRNCILHGDILLWDNLTDINLEGADLKEAIFDSGELPLVNLKETMHTQTQLDKQPLPMVMSSPITPINPYSPTLKLLQPGFAH